MAFQYLCLSKYINAETWNEVRNGVAAVGNCLDVPEFQVMFRTDSGIRGTIRTKIQNKLIKSGILYIREYILIEDSGFLTPDQNTTFFTELRNNLFAV